MKATNIKSKFISLPKECILVINKLFSDSISKLRFITIFDMLLKTILFLTVIHNTPASKNQALYTSIKFSLVYLAFILLIYALATYFLGRNKLYFIFFLICSIVSF